MIDYLAIQVRGFPHTLDIEYWHICMILSSLSLLMSKANHCCSALGSRDGQMLSPLPSPLPPSHQATSGPCLILYYCTMQLQLDTGPRVQLSTLTIPEIYLVQLSTTIKVMIETVDTIGGH